MSDPGHSPPASREFVFRTIRLLMFVDIAIGGALILLGVFVFDSPDLVIAGAFLACMGVGLTVLFRLLARRARAPGPLAGRDSPHQLRR